MLVVHAADIHLDSPLRGLSRLGDDYAAELRGATRRALVNLVDLVIDKNANLLVIAGDLYDGSWHDFGTGHFFIEQMSKLHDSGVPVVIASGNHDAASQITQSLTLPPDVHLLDVDQPQSITFDDFGAVVHGQGYAVRDMQENLAAAYPSRIPELLNVGILHTCATGSNDHLRYAPCSVADLEALRYDYMALGHIHARNAVADGDFPAHFSGNLQGRNPKETGPKGALLVELDGRSPARIKFEPLDVARWEQVNIDASDIVDWDELVLRTRDGITQASRDAQGRTLIVRIKVTGRTKLARELNNGDGFQHEMYNIAKQAGAVLDKAIADVQPPAAPDPEAQRLRDAVTAAADQLIADDGAVRTDLAVLDRDIRDIARDSEGCNLDLTDRQAIQDLVARARDVLDARLAERQG